MMPNYAAIYPDTTACYQQFYTPWPTPEALGSTWAHFSPCGPTTICFRNIPNDYSGKMVIDLLDGNSCKDTYNFIYVPHDFKRLPTLVNVGYFFVNFHSHDLAMRAWEALDGFHKWASDSRKVLAASWATKTQGYQACVLRYQSSSVMQQDVPFECKPMFFENGEAVHQFPTKRQFPGEKVKSADCHVEGAVHGSRYSFLAREPTTLCFRNIPNNYDGKMILELLDENGCKESYNFVYVPHDFQRLPMLVNVGYFFVNFTTHAAALQAWDKLQGFDAWRLESNKVLSASWATKTQGLDACIQRYKDSPVLRQDVPFGCKPMRFDNGQAVQLDHVVRMQPSQSADACLHGQTIDRSWNAHVHAEKVIGGSDSADEADTASVATESPEDAFSTSMCSSDTEDSEEMTICAPDEAAFPDTTSSVLCITRQLAMLKDVLPTGRPRWADIYDDEPSACY
jgi:hypothetical protein